MKEILKFCPFCGEIKTVTAWEELSQKRAGCIICGVFVERNTFDEAIKIWNRRKNERNI